MPTIHTLKPNVTREQAIRQFSSGLPGWLRHATLGPLRLLAVVYIPFRLFQIDITNHGHTETRLLGVDAITGSLDPYDFERERDSTKLILIGTRNSLAPRLNERCAAQMAVDKTRRILFSRGFFRMRALKIVATYASETWYVPYWVAFHGANSKASVSVIDAVRRRFEGAKVRTLLQDWLNEDWPVLVDIDARAGSARATPSLEAYPHSSNPRATTAAR
jgi:hypothetical protein